MKIERLNLAAVPCRQRPKRAPEARRRPNGSVLQVGFYWSVHGRPKWKYIVVEKSV